MKIYINIVFIILCLTSCTTYKTLIPTQQQKLVIFKNEIGNNEKCVSIPNLYSGTIYSGCVMFGHINPQHSMQENISMLPLNFIADTLSLPYTIYKQCVEGNIVLKKVLKEKQLYEK